MTLPAALRPMARSHQHRIANLLVPTSAAAWQTLARDPTSLGGQSGLVGVLHPWTRDLASHPPLHALVPGGALAPEGVQGLSPRAAAWLVPVRARSRLFRGTCQAALTPAGRCDPVPPQVWRTDWVTHGQPAGPGPAVRPSCAPSISRFARTTNRLATRADGPVTCRCKASGSHPWTHGP